MKSLDTNKSQYKKADARNPYMGLDNMICKDPVYWCRLHEVWLSEKDVQKKKCKERLTLDMIEARRCTCLDDKRKERMV